jgi:ParB family chromosome partitioning protein
MGKLDDMRRLTAGNVDESMGVGRPAVHGAPAAAGPPTPARWQGVSKSRNAAEIPVDRIGPDPAQPREEFDAGALGRLADSLKARGQIQPITVRWDEGGGRYVIVCGERRWRAAELAGLTTMSCVVLDKPAPPGDLLALQLVENLLREDLKPIEQARAYRSLIESNGWTVSQVARELAVDHSNVSRALALLDLPAAVQTQVEQGALPPATAYEISKVAGAGEQADLAARVVSEGLSRAETVAAVRERKPAAPKGRGAGRAKKVTSRTLKTSVGVKVTLECRRGLDDALVRAALAELTARLDAKAGDAQAAA